MKTTVTVLSYVIFLNKYIFLRFYFSDSVSIVNIYRTKKTVFDYNSKHLGVCQKHSAVRRILNSIHTVWKCGLGRMRRGGKLRDPGNEVGSLVVELN